MKTKLLAGWRVLAVVGLASVALPSMAMTAMSMPAEQYRGSVGYVTGGIGEREANLEHQLKSHPLAVELLEHAGKAEEFTANAMVRITDWHGHTVLDARAGGPFMLVDLPPGRYSIQATLAGDTLRKSHVWVTEVKTARATFEFPAGTDNWIPVRVRVASADIAAPYSLNWRHAGLGG
jgi:hypothetical protein